MTRPRALPHVVLLALLAAGTVQRGYAGGRPFIKVPITYHDFKRSHADFQKGGSVQQHGLFKGLVNVDLSPQRRPVWSGAGTINGVAKDATKPPIKNSTTFDQWFSDVPGVNHVIQGQLVFFHQNNTRTWTSSARRFHPIDKMGWNDKMHGRNYLFTGEMHLDFNYRGGEYFTFRGDDDVWVFINDKLVIDMGGYHGPRQETQKLDTLSLSKSHKIHMDIFFAERHCCGSHLHISTNVDLEAADAVTRGKGNQLIPAKVEEEDIVTEWMSMGWYDNSQCAGTPMHVDVFSSGQCFHMAPYVHLKLDATASLGVNIEMERTHLYQNVKATCSGASMELFSYDEFSDCFIDNHGALDNRSGTSPLFKGPMSTSGCIHYKAGAAAGGSLGAKGTDVWFSPRCDLDLACSMKGNPIAGFKVYSVVNSCQPGDDDQYPDFYRLIPADKQCIQTSSPVSADKYTSTHECSGNTLLTMTEYPSGEGMAADQRCTQASTKTVSITTDNCAGQTTPLGDVAPGDGDGTTIPDMDEPKSLDNYIPVHKLTCNQKSLEFLKECPFPLWVWVLIIGGSVLLVFLLILFFTLGPGKNCGSRAKEMELPRMDRDGPVAPDHQMHKLNPLASQSARAGMVGAPGQTTAVQQPMHKMARLQPPSLSAGAPQSAKLRPPALASGDDAMLPPFDASKYTAEEAADNLSFIDEDTDPDSMRALCKEEGIDVFGLNKAGLLAALRSFYGQYTK